MSSKRRIRKNACISKVKYTTKELATQAMMALIHRRGFSGLMTAYRCPFCRGYHFGHASGKIRQSIAAKKKNSAP